MPRVPQLVKGKDETVAQVCLMFLTGPKVGSSMEE